MESGAHVTIITYVRKSGAHVTIITYVRKSGAHVTTITSVKNRSCWAIPFALMDENTTKEYEGRVGHCCMRTHTNDHVRTLNIL